MLASRAGSRRNTNLAPEQPPSAELPTAVLALLGNDIGLRRLAAECAARQASAGFDPFKLSVRAAAEASGSIDAVANQLLLRLCALGVILKVEAGGSMRAAQWLYLPAFGRLRAAA